MLYIGSSGFYYDHWIGRCYPEAISKRDLLPYYAKHFKSVEINSSFYHFPRQSTVEHWLEVTPEDFTFTLKANRRITHYKKLADAHSDVYAFLHIIKPLKAKLGAILFQLPPQLQADLPLLEDFTGALPSGYRYAFEFRHPSWIGDALFELLAEKAIGFCINDFDGETTPWAVTAPFAYVRMHGPEGRYRGRYDVAAVDALCDKLKTFGDKEVYCYFNNDMEGFAWDNAAMLMQTCAKEGDAG